MREIEFRGKRKDDRKWMYGSLQIDGEYAAIKEQGRAWPNALYVTVDRETVGQYTGLKDKNGKKIYEGDIVRVFTEAKTFNDGFDDYPEREYIRKVEITEASFGLLSVFGGFMMGSLCNPTVEVIGNIHDNPELLKETDNA